MKKAVIFLLILTVTFSFISCTDGGDNFAEDVTEKIAETLSKTVSHTDETFAQPSVTVQLLGENKNFFNTLNGEAAATVASIIEKDNWITSEATPDCLTEYIITVNGNEYMYSSHCGSVIKSSTQWKTLTDEESAAMGRYVHLYGSEDDSFHSGLQPKEDETCIRQLPGHICDPYLFSTNEKGVELFVKASTNPVKKGENFVLTATATNRTGKTIYIHLPTGTENSHEEIDVVIKDENNRRFVDLDTQGRAFTCDTKMITLENGESIVQVMNMAPGYLIDGSMYPLGEPITYFDAGTYYGEAVFNWHYVKYDVKTGEIDEMQTAKLDFSIIVE
ncbi:MAG: hypothetical protein E7547_08815 [Ruminococcaceae bacterium]|nr:hypothetical protein [Oscillospiraceae bacterium]